MVDRAAARGSAELRERAELEAVYESAPIGLCVVDADLRYVRINERLAAFHGLPASEHLGRTVWEVLPHLAGVIAPLYQHVLDTGEPLLDVELSGRTVARPGEECHWLASYYPLRAPDGRVIAVNVAVIDITESKRAMNALRESEARFMAFMDNSPITTFLKDEAGRYVYMNPAGAAVLGTTPANVIGKTDVDIFNAEEARQVHRNDLVALAAGKPIEITEELLQDRVPQHFHTIKFRIDAPGHWYIGGISVNITEREQLLEAERTARAEAERANRMKDEFLATLSHELRTPLSAVLGYTQMLQSGQIRPEGVPRALEIIARNARVQIELVSDLLDMNRIITGKLQLELAPADMGAIADAAVESVRQSADAKGIQIDVDVVRVPRPVMGDQARLQQVLWNLLTNAVKFTPRGGRVTLSVRPAGGTVEVRVADSGQGIAADFLPHVFDRFRQADSSTSRQHGGLGLGLAISRQIVQMHGGTIQAESPGDGLGAVFTVRLPLASQAEDTVHLARAKAADAEVGATLRGLRALVVDDETDARDLVRALLEARGMQVRAAASAAEALSAVEKEVPQVIISDIGMPCEDGYSLMRRLRSLPPDRGGQVPAVALTAFARPEDQERARQAGYQRHLPKPIDAGQLYAAVAGLTAPARKDAA